MANSNYTDWLKNLPIPWLSGGPVGQANAGVLGGELDDQIDFVKQAVKAHMPGYGPDDAIPHMANDHVLIQGPSESDIDFRLRIKFAWEQWVFAGSALGILVQLYFQGYRDMLIVQQNGLGFQLTGTLPAFVTPGAWDPTPNLVITQLGLNPNISDPAIVGGHPAWWTFDLNTQFCSRFALIFTPPLPTGWTSVVSPPTTTSAPSLSEVNTIRSIVHTWAAGKATCIGIYALVQGWMIGWPVRQIASGAEIGFDLSSHPPIVVSWTP